MSLFLKFLNGINPSTSNRNWLFVPYDQLTDSLGPLNAEDPRTLAILMVENPWKAERRPYHKQKLAMILSNMRHFAVEQAERGVAVKYVVGNGPYRNVVEPIAREVGPIRVMTPAEWELRNDLEPLVHAGLIRMVNHEGWLTKSRLLDQTVKPGPRWRMDDFYREARRSTGLLMSDNKPLGGKYSHDAKNRLPWRGTPIPPNSPCFPINPIKEEVGRLIENRFAHHPGKLNLEAIPCTREDAENMWSWAKDNCLEWFGPYEDAMSSTSTGLFHTRISSLLNICRLLPSKLVYEVEALDIPLQSQEGFIRQALGWREFVHHIHTLTEGFRSDLKIPLSNVNSPSDGGYRHWAGKNWPTQLRTEVLPEGAQPNWMESYTPLPPAYWGKPSGLACLDRVVSSVWDEGYSHHITRLMVLCNIATLLEVNPRELTDWFWIAYIDAFDWVVEPNVLGMGTYALGPLITTKPYVAGANYINRMSDFCSICGFHPYTTCPITPLYWAFLNRHRGAFDNVPRLMLPLKMVDKRDESLKQKDRAIFNYIKNRLSDGSIVKPDVVK
ncbi:MAG: cryptochrome/photolyase family protein [Desulfomonilaceae bacterium]